MSLKSIGKKIEENRSDPIPSKANEYDPPKLYDKHGKETKDINDARSVVTFEPHKFTFYTKRYSAFWGLFGLRVVVWDYHHTSSTFGSWMWPDGLPLRFDGVCNVDRSLQHAEKIGSMWEPRSSSIPRA